MTTKEQEDIILFLSNILASIQKDNQYKTEEGKYDLVSATLNTAKTHKELIGNVPGEIMRGLFSSPPRDFRSITQATAALKKLKTQMKGISAYEVWQSLGSIWDILSIGSAAKWCESKSDMPHPDIPKELRSIAASRQSINKSLKAQISKNKLPRKPVIGR